MLKKIVSYIKKKMSFSRAKPKNALWFGAFLFFAGLILFLPLPALGLAREIGNAVAQILSLTIIQLIVFLTNLFLSLAVWFLGWITSPSFIGVPFTQNVFVTPNWALVRDLANMCFVIALVAIGLGTALRIGEYNVQKTLPLLVIMALAVNFTPVICGFIIDASNIAMNFFLGEGLSFSGFEDLMARTASYWRTLTSDTNPFEALGMGLALIAFNVFGGLIIILFALLFAVRYVFLWMLVILSPLAFFAYILPSTRKFWTQWWNQFIQWCFIGVEAGFWLYLAFQIIQTMEGIVGTAPPSSEFGGLSAVFAYTIPIVFLWSGFGTALASAAPVAGAIMGAAGQVKGEAVKLAGKTKTIGKVAAGAAGLAAGAGLAGLKTLEAAEGTLFKTSKIRGVRETATETLKEGVKSLAKIPAVGEGELGFGGFAKRVASGTILELARKAGRTQLTTEETAKKEIADAEKEVEKAAVDMIISKFRSAKKATEKIGYLNRLAKQGDIDEAISKGMTHAEMVPVLKEARKHDAHKEIISAMPHLEQARMHAIAASQGISVGEAYAKPIAGVSEAGFIGKIKPARAGQVSSQVFGELDAMEGIVRSWDGRHVSKLIDSHGTRGVDAIEGTINRLATTAGQTPEGWLRDNNLRLLQYIRSSAGRQFFTL